MYIKSESEHEMEDLDIVEQYQWLSMQKEFVHFCARFTHPSKAAKKRAAAQHTGHFSLKPSGKDPKFFPIPKKKSFFCPFKIIFRAKMSTKSTMMFKMRNQNLLKQQKLVVSLLDGFWDNLPLCEVGVAHVKTNWRVSK